MSAFHSMINRLVNIPLDPSEFKEELNVIKQIAVNNGYKSKTIHHLLKSKLLASSIQSIFPKNNKSTNNEGVSYRKIPFINKKCNLLKKPLLSKNIKPAFFNKNTLGNILINNKLDGFSDKYQKCGVYKINCNNCDACYIGKTKRQIKTRFKEHVGAGANGKQTSGFAKHLIETGHFADLTNLDLLHHIRDGRILDKYEVFEIRRALYYGCALTNDQTDFNDNSPLLDPKFICNLNNT